MDTTAAPIAGPHSTALDDVRIPLPPLPQMSLRETYAFKAIALDKTGKMPELATRIYITSNSSNSRSPQDHAAEWIRKTQADPKAQFKLVEQGVVSLSGVPPIRDRDNKVMREPYCLVFESQGARDYPGEAGDHSESKRHIQRFYFLPVSSDEVVTVRTVRRLEYELPNSQFSKQFQHFLNTLKVETATPQSSIAGSGPRLRRYYTAHLSFEIPTGDDDTGNQWSIDHGASYNQRWQSPHGEIQMGIGIISGYDFRVADKNKRLQQIAKDLVANLPGVVKDMGGEPNRYSYLQKKIGPYEMYGHKGDDGYDTVIELDLAYKTGKQLHLRFGGPTAAINAAEPAIYDWLAKFQFLP